MNLNSEDYRRKARWILPKFAFDYVDGGAETESAMASNRNVFSKWGFIPSVLVDCDKRDTSVTWFDQTFSAPFAVAPTGYNGMLCNKADEHLALAAASKNIPYIQSTVSTSSIEDIGQHKLSNHWFQLYVLRDRKVTENLLDRARAQGCSTLVVSADAVYFGNRERDKRHYAKPFQLSLKSYFNIAMHPWWVSKVIVPQGVPGFGNLVPYLPKEYQKGVGAAAYFAEQMDPTLDWETLKWVRELWPGKLVVKGIMNRADAKRAVETGCDGIVLSNHGGRQLDYTVSPVDMLADIRDEVGNDMLLWVDSGFRRGTDIVKAIALGANGVLIGRPFLYALAVERQQGAEKMMTLLQQEVDRTMAQLGCKTISDIHSSLLHKM
ncbi:alpha-hydroxy acid oxidase [Vibrio viridaestus]|uniref:Alpha-hydroxy-acid oxidizing protein n=1 Tax=Vibrio viridaestus TaxID=2487322 RepID=A0A3N9TGB6_9VIBR|nr:alpha-hydroxy acid oxidase [Vibrio viridaestus]RQW63311.1 alpha-hydroxy-acid oxidizing protein [Vibrio viridaestus]